MVPLNILHLEDNPHDAELVSLVLREEWPDCRITVMGDESSYRSALHQSQHDLILSDFSLVSFTGLDALRLARTHRPETPFIFLSGTLGEDCAIEAVQSGAADYVLKDRMKRLVTAIHRALRESTERRARLEAERRLREQTDIINRAPLAILMVDLDDRITYCNDGAAALLGLPAQQLVGRATPDVFPPETTALFAKGSDATLASGSWHEEVPLQTHDQREIVVEFFLSLIRNDQGNPQARLMIGVDVTEKRRLQEQFLRSQRMENLGLLAAGMAHDFNNILSPVMMAANLFREHRSGTDNQRLIGMLEQSARRGASLVRQILAFAQGTGGERIPLQPRHVLQDIRTLVEETFPPSLRFDADIARDLWMVRGNATQLHQVFLNLCVNARDAMPAQGHLFLRARNLRLDELISAQIPGARPGAFVLVEVEDNGTGIAPEVLEHIWEPFFTTKCPGKGTGLGLSTVRGIVANHHGFCTVQSTVGHGTRFQIFLPAEGEPGSESLPTTHSATPPRGAGETILVVDDDDLVRKFIAATLKSHGYQVVTASDGLDALARFEGGRQPFRLAIVDLLMPNFDGESLIRLLRPRHPALRFIVISGMSDSDNSPGSLGDTFLAKPFQPEKLLAEVDRLLHAPGQPLA